MKGVVRYLRNVWGYRYFWLSLVRADLRQRYRRSVLGIFWSVLNPLAMTAIICVVYQQLLNVDPREFVPYLLTGLAFWNWVSSNVLMGCASFYQAESYIRHEPVPVAIFPLRTTLTVGFHFLLLTIVALALSWGLQGIGSGAALLSLVPILMLFFVLGWSVAILAGFLNVYFPDTQHLSEVGLQILFYSTPIIYRIGDLHSGLASVQQYNPLLILVELLRAPIFAAEAPALSQFGLVALIALLPALLAVTVVARYEHRLVYEM